MKRMFMLLAVLMTLTVICYASFPILEYIEVDSLQTINNGTTKGGLLFAVLSVVLSLLSVLFIFLFIGNGFAHNGNPFPYLLLSIVSIIATILSGIEAKRRGLKKTKAFVGISTVIVSLLLIRYLLFD